MNILFKSVKNFQKGRNGNVIKGICIHIAEGNAWQVYQTFNSEPKSSHYLVLKNGNMWQFVLERDQAWAQGYKDRPSAKLVLDNININPNEYLVSIEFEGYGSQDITEIQYMNGGKLIAEIAARNALQLNRETILRHNEIRKSKTCPGFVSVEKLIKYAFNPPDISEIESLKTKISLLQKIMELLKSLVSFQRLGGGDDEKGVL